MHQQEPKEFEAGRCVCFNMGTAGGAHLVELPQILLLCLVDYSQDSGDGLANNTAVKNKQQSQPCNHLGKCPRQEHISCFNVLKNTAMILTNALLCMYFRSGNKNRVNHTSIYKHTFKILDQSQC